jgi:hypothetical protein
MVRPSKCVNMVSLHPLKKLNAIKAAPLSRLHLILIITQSIYFQIILAYEFGKKIFWEHIQIVSLTFKSQFKHHFLKEFFCNLQTKVSPPL